VRGCRRPYRGTGNRLRRPLAARQGRGHEPGSGGPQAQATGTSDYVGPNQSVASGRQETATVVAFDLGTCDGKLMYQAVEWYFPQHGQTFHPGRYENVCSGTYVRNP